MGRLIRMLYLSATAAVAALALTALAYAALWVALVAKLACGAPVWASLLIYITATGWIAHRVVNGPRKM